MLNEPRKIFPFIILENIAIEHLIDVRKKYWELN